MNRAEILSHALFDSGGEIDGIRFGPLSQPCLVILKRRKNGLFTESTRDQDEHEAIGEIFFVVSRTKEQRAAMFRDSAEEWDLKAGEFMAGLDDNTLPKFRDEYLGPALSALALAVVESEMPGKPLPTRPTSPSSSKALAGSASTISPRASAEKTSGTFQPALSCNSSTRKQPAKAQGSGGSTGPKRHKKSSTNLKNSRTAK
jgi:hypothetical protein